MADLVFTTPVSPQDGSVELHFGAGGPYAPDGNLVFSAPAQSNYSPVNLQFGSGGPPEPVDYGLKLVFDQPVQDAPGAVDLYFGGKPAAPDPSETTTGTIDAVIPGPAASIEAAYRLALSINATLGLPNAIFAAGYDINVARHTSVATRSPWRQSRRPWRGPRINWQSARQLRPDAVIPWEAARRVAHAVVGPFAAIPRVYGSPALRWEQAQRRVGSAQSGWENPARQSSAPRVCWGAAARVVDAIGSIYRYPPSLRVFRACAWRQAMRPWSEIIDFSFAGAEWAPKAWLFPYQEARQPPFGESVLVLTPPSEPIPQYAADNILRFCSVQIGAPWILRFGVDPCGGRIFVPVRRVYVVLNSAALTRVSDGLDIPAASLSLSIDVDSFAWSFSATLLGPGALALVKNSDGVPVEVEAQINGESWRALIDSWGHTRAFGERAISVRGRGLAAYLAEPYAAVRTYTETADRLAQQLAAQELPIGWALDWQLSDWLVPAGAWSYAGKSPMAAIGAIAAAAGGYVQGAAAAKTVTVAHRYPTAPWGWAGLTPDVSLPIDVLTQLGTEWQPRQPANNVYVSGRDQGVLVRVQRDGTAGDISLPLVVDPLITEVVAGRQRGTAEIANSLRHSTEALALPLDAGTGGLILPGKLIEVTGDAGGPWRGLVRATSISAGRQGGLSVRQQIDIERHHPEAA